MDALQHDALLHYVFDLELKKHEIKHRGKMEEETDIFLKCHQFGSWFIQVLLLKGLTVNLIQFRVPLFKCHCVYCTVSVVLYCSRGILLLNFIILCNKHRNMENTPSNREILLLNNLNFP